MGTNPFNSFLNRRLFSPVLNVSPGELHRRANKIVFKGSDCVVEMGTKRLVFQRNYSGPSRARQGPGVIHMIGPKGGFGGGTPKKILSDHDIETLVAIAVWDNLRLP